MTNMLFFGHCCAMMGYFIYWSLKYQNMANEFLFPCQTNFNNFLI